MRLGLGGGVGIGLGLVGGRLGVTGARYVGVMVTQVEGVVGTMGTKLLPACRVIAGCDGDEARAVEPVVRENTTLVGGTVVANPDKVVGVGCGTVVVNSLGVGLGVCPVVGNSLGVISLAVSSLGVGLTVKSLLGEGVVLPVVDSLTALGEGVGAVDGTS